MKILSIQDVVRSGLCISCGACAGVAPNGSIRMVEVPGKGMSLPQVHKSGATSGKGLEFAVCPGKGYPIMATGRKLFGETAFEDLELGSWRGIWASRATQPQILRNASSGGVMTAIAAHLISSCRAQGAVVTRIRYGSPGPRGQTFVGRSLKELLEAQGSKYCPVDALSILRRIEKLGGRFVFLGTPCQIAALRLLQQKKPEWKDKIPFCIGNFCGGFRDLRETDAIVRRAGIRPDEVRQFRYRGEGQPGFMRIEDESGRCVTLAYPGYARRTGYAKNNRCRLCVDATAELADFACGDAWIPRFLESGYSWSLLMTRSEQAEAIVQEMAVQNQLRIMKVSVCEVKESQYGNLLSKKKRQRARRRLMKLLGAKLPEFGGGYYADRGGLVRELKLYLWHMFLYVLERCGLYPLFAKLIKRV